MPLFERAKELAERAGKLIEPVLSSELVVPLAVAVATLVLAGIVPALVSLEYVPLTVPMVGRSRSDQAVAETIVYAVLLAAGFFGLLMVDDALSGPRRDDTKLALGLFLLFFSIFFCSFIVFGLKGFRF